MFTCTICKKLQPSGTPSKKVPTRIRNVEYTIGEQQITLGTEVVREIVSCHDCPTPTPEVIPGKKEILVQNSRRLPENGRRGRFESPRQAKMDD